MSFRVLTKPDQLAFSDSHYAGRKSADRIPFPKIFWGLKFQLKMPNRSTWISLHKHAFKKL